MAKQTYDMGSVKKQAQREQDRASGGGLKGKQMKLTAGKNRVLILQPYNKKGTFFKTVMVHQIWKNKKPVATATCARAVDGNDCGICTYGWKLKDKYEDHKSEKKQNLWRNFMPTNDFYVNVLNLGNGKSYTPQFLKLPTNAKELLLNEVDETEDVSDIFGLDDGRAMRIKGNGENGTNRRYKIVKFEKKSVNLVSEGDVDEDEIIDKLNKLEGLEPKFSEKKLEAMFKKLKKAFLSAADDDLDDDEDEVVDDEDADEEVDADEDDDDSDFEDDDDDDDVESDDDDDDDDVEDDDDDEPPKKTKKKKGDKKSKSKDSKKSKSKKSKNSKKSKKRKR